MQLLGLPLLFLFAETPIAVAVVAKSTAGVSKNGRSGVSNAAFPMDLGFGANGDLPNANAEDVVSVPGEGAIEDEMVALKRPLPFLSSSAPKHWAPVPVSLLKAQSKGMMKGASFSSDVIESTAQSPSVPQAPRNAKVLEEYDVTPDDDEHADDYRTVNMKETQTAEVIERQQKGDVERIKPTEHKKPKIVIRKLNLATETQKSSKVATGQTVVAEAAPGNDKMMGQCMAFANWVKSQGSTGPDLVRIWKGTCMPAVMSGEAPPAYGNMCNALGTAVQKFAVRPWQPADMCQAVLQVFKESGIGATPL